ncbi:MAG: DUF2461 domain-containing protein [Candidatus Limnocylindrales bacterium]
MSQFAGLSPKAFQFLVDLAMNNDRSWFQPRKTDYERLLKEPIEALCVALDAELAARGIPLAADPARSPFRIYRDVRFSKDKSPYKTHVSASFPWTGRGGGVGGYVHLQPGECYIGGGMWHPTTARLAAWRAKVVGERAAVHGVVNDPAFVAAFGSVSGDALKRAPSGFAVDDPDIELLKLKDVTFGRRITDDEACSADLPATIAATFEPAVPLLGLLADLPGADEPSGWLRA